MTVFLVSTWVVKLDKASEYMAFSKKYLTWMKERPDLFKEVKSYKVFSNMLGGNYSGGVEMIEFESLSDLEKWLNRYTSDKEHMTKIWPEFAPLVVPETFSSSVWASVT